MTQHPTQMTPPADLLANAGNTVPNHWLRAIIHHADVKEPHATEALRLAGLDYDTHLATAGAPLPVPSEALVMQYLSELRNDPATGVRLGLSLDPRNTSLLTYMLFNSSSLDNALSNLAQFVRVTRPRVQMSYRRDAKGGHLFIENEQEKLATYGQFMEFTVSALLGAFRHATGAQIHPLRIGFAHVPRTPETLAKILGTHLSLGETAASVSFSPEDLKRPIRGADKALMTHLTGYGHLLLERLPKQAVQGILDKVRHILSQQMDHRMPHIEQIASQMGLSQRTLARRLTDEGTSYREITRKTRQSRAEAFLSDPGLTMGEIAFLTGFNDQSSFSEAFKRWTGKSPSHFRVIALKNQNS